MSAQQKVIVVKRDDRATLPPDVLDRRWLIDLRRGLLQQLAAVEKKLNIERRCENCGYVLSK